MPALRVERSGIVGRMRAVLAAFLAVSTLCAGESGEKPRLDPARAKDIRDDTSEAEREWPSDAIDYLLGEAEKPEVALYAKDLAQLTATSDTSPDRFAFVWFRGRLEELKEEADLFQGRVVFAEGAPTREALFVTRPPTESEGAPGEVVKLIENGFVRVRGIYVKRYRPDAKAEGPAFLVVATFVERAYETKPVRSLEDVGFDAVRDDQEFLDGGGKGDPPSRLYPLTLMRLVKLAEAGAPAGAIHEEFAGGMDPLLRNPAKVRGRLVRGTGVVALESLRYGLWECAPNDAGVESYVMGWIVSDGRQLLQFVAPDRLAGIGKAKERVRLTGFFYKVKAYPARDGTTRIAPIFVLTDLALVR